MNTYSRDIIIRNVYEYHDHLKLQLDKFFDRQRDFQFYQSIIRDNEWQNLNDSQMKYSFKLEKIREKSNTIKNIQLLKKNPTINDLRYIALLTIISKILLVKYLKSEDSFSKFVSKLLKNKLKTFNEKKLSKKKKIIEYTLKKKIEDYKSKQIDINKINLVISDITKLNFTTQRSLNKRIELVDLLKQIIKKCQKIELDFSGYVNYLPDHIFSRLKSLTKIKK